jgi:hypothetical protein
LQSRPEVADFLCRSEQEVREKISGLKADGRTKLFLVGAAIAPTRGGIALTSRLLTRHLVPLVPQVFLDLLDLLLGLVLLRNERRPRGGVFGFGQLENG